MLTPILKLVKDIGGTVCGKPGGPDGTMPKVPGPVTKPRSERLAKPLSGSLLCVAVRKKLKRNSLTFVDPRVLVLLSTNCCASVGVRLEKPGTLLPPYGSNTEELSQW